MSLPSPAISVIIVSWNNEKYLLTCLEHLSAQTFRDFEVLIVDNNDSEDAKSDNFVKVVSAFPVRVERLGENLGFSIANNIGVRLARGKWIALLNADAFPEPDWLEQLMHGAETNSQFSFFTSRQIQANDPELLDGAGDAYHVSGLAWRLGYNQSVKEHGLQQKEVFSACAAAAMYRKDDFLKVDGFDEDYFSYFEDVDLSFRLRLIGGRCLYIPQAVVHHVGSASTGKASDFSFYHGHRNLVWTFFKDMPGLLFWMYLPLHMAMNIYLSFAFLLRENRNVVLKSKLAAFRSLPAILRKRKQVQKMRIVGNRDIYRVMIKEIFAPHYASRARTKKD